VTELLTALFGKTVMLAGAIAVMNVLLPSLIKTRFTSRTGLMLGVYTMMLSVSASVAAAVTIPIYRFSGSIDVVLAAPAAAAVLALVVWVTQAGYTSGQALRSSALPMVRHGLAWHIAIFFGLQSAAFYAVLSWLPTIYRERGVDATRAGLYLSLVSAASVVSSLVVPPLAYRVADQRWWVISTSGLMTAGLLGVIAAPVGSAPVWILVFGLGVGSGIALSLLIIVVRAADADSSAALSGMSQSFGYLVAATGPLAVGLLHTATGNWVTPVLFLVAVSVAMLPFGLHSAREGVIPVQS
jgi:MFS transporter, CP family, cyanate transporter